MIKLLRLPSLIVNNYRTQLNRVTDIMLLIDITQLNRHYEPATSTKILCTKVDMNFMNKHYIV
jgi:hypothetical protein